MIKKRLLKKFTMTRSEKKNFLEAYTFLLPFIIGIALILIFPLYMSIKLSFGDLVSMRGFVVKWSGVQHYINAFIVDAYFIPKFLIVLRDTLIRVPLIIIFSLILAILLNKSIFGKSFFRVAMFLPFLIGSGYIMTMLKQQGITTSALSLTDSPIFPIELLNYMGTTIQDAINAFFEVIVTVLWSSGVQILLFLSGLQGIPGSLYESAQVDGANAVEVFFKITVPMMMPITSLNIIYTIVNQFTESDNLVLQYIEEAGFWNYRWEDASAIGWIYFVFILLLIGGVLLAIKLATRNKIIKN